jgi:hypothetical protein
MLLRLAKKAAEVAGVVGKTDLGFPIKHRKKRLVAAVMGLAVAAGYLNPEIAAALEELILALSE